MRQLREEWQSSLQALKGQAKGTTRALEQLEVENNQLAKGLRELQRADPRGNSLPVPVYIVISPYI